MKFFALCLFVFLCLYPEELAAITDREKEVVNAIIFTAESTHVHHLRGRIMGFLK